MLPLVSLARQFVQRVVPQQFGVYAVAMWSRTMSTTHELACSTTPPNKHVPKYWETLVPSKGITQYWANLARSNILWEKDFHTTLSYIPEIGQVAWFLGGKLNASVNCIDRHLPDKRNKTALIWEQDEPGKASNVTYGELYESVSRIANVLKKNGVKKGDRVCIYMPMTPYVVYTMLACARIGAVHSVVFAGFSAEALSSRIIDAKCHVIVTADEGVRGGKTIPLRKTVATALENPKCREIVKHVLVQRRTGVEGGVCEDDIDLISAMEMERPYCAPEVMDAEDPLFLLYTSGSTGAPKGLLHTTGGFLTQAMISFRAVFDYQPNDIYGCFADVGWVTGHTYLTYGPLLNGATALMFESVPTFPDPGRFWRVVEEQRLTQIYTAPTAIRLLMKHSDEFVTKYDRSSLRVLGTVGEPINPEAYDWYHKVVGEQRCTVVDTWWQTETGGVMMTPLPGQQYLKPGAAMSPFPGMVPVLLDADGNELDGNSVRGLLAFKYPSPGMARTVFGNHKRYVETYWQDYPGYYFTGDGARRDRDGHYWIIGRVDDVINVSGHRMGTAEVESALLENKHVAESAVVGFPHDIKGQGIYAFVVMKDGEEVTNSTTDELKQIVRREIGPFAVPDQIVIAPDLPKTRSGKIMRRILRKIASDDMTDFGDMSTLADPSVVELLINQHNKAMGKE
eukprot:m.136660 g.136660  ORF g.136660 m.136660 type:complete len:680 (+) comp10806_c0_seq1:88-2127(+)